MLGSFYHAAIRTRNREDEKQYTIAWLAYRADQPRLADIVKSPRTCDLDRVKRAQIRMKRAKS
jgi:hypothetical protein